MTSVQVSKYKRHPIDGGRYYDPTSKTIDVSKYSSFVVTGVLKSGERFAPIKFSGTVGGAKTALNINLWNGSVWGVLKKTGRRELIKSVVN